MAERLDFVDTHVHFWERPHPKLEWAWLADDAIHPQLGAIRPLKDMTSYKVDELRADSAGLNVTKIVHVQAAIGSADPVDETEWLQAMADETGWPTGITGDARLQHADVEGTLERHCEFSNMRGLRDFGEGDYLVDRPFTGATPAGEVQLGLRPRCAVGGHGQGRRPGPKVPQHHLDLRPRRVSPRAK